MKRKGCKIKKYKPRVSFRKKLEQERKNLAYQNDFLSNVSHDMRTPLNGILGFTQLALATDDLVQVKDYLRKIQVSGSLLLDLINDTLMLSKLESGKLEPQYEVIDNRVISSRILTPLAAVAAAKGVKLIGNRDKSPQVIVGRWINTQKIFTNLISNAIKYTPPGGTVEVIMERLDKPLENCNFRFVVKDTGIGISQQFLPHIFEPFTQEYGEDSRGIVGTGLGLSIVQKLVTLLKGQIGVESIKGQGTTFTVLLPLTLVEHPDAEQRKLQAIQVAPQVWMPLSEINVTKLAGKKILVCEDNELNQEITCAILRHHGLETDVAENGQAGAKFFSESSPGDYAAILMDLRMPVLNGYDSAKLIRSMARPDAAVIPIIALSADAFEDEQQKTHAAGMTSYLSKPIDPKVLLTELLKYCT